jgi:hypothetical protein
MAFGPSITPNVTEHDHVATSSFAKTSERFFAVMLGVGLDVGKYVASSGAIVQQAAVLDL